MKEKGLWVPLSEGLCCESNIGGWGGGRGCDPIAGERMVAALEGRTAPSKSFALCSRGWLWCTSPFEPLLEEMALPVPLSPPGRACNLVCRSKRSLRAKALPQPTWVQM